MKTFNCLLIILFTSVSALSQDIVVEVNASLEVQIGADICTDSLIGEGSININGTFCGNTTDIEIKSTDSSLIIPDVFSLEQNYPNPFNPSTTIRFSLPVQTHLKINIYNMLGELVKTISEGTYEVGYYSVSFDAAELSSGTYIYRIESENFTETKKMILLR
jgi:hypothetical protein